MTITNVTATLALRLFSWLPLRANHAVGSVIGQLFQLIPNRHRQVIESNLEICFPNMPVMERKSLVQKNLWETGKNLTELGAFWHWSKPRVAALVVDEKGSEILQEAIAGNKGVIIAAPHVGAWELIGLTLSRSYAMHFLYRPNRIESLDDTLIEARERFGAKCHPISRRGLSALVRALKQGEIIGVLPDQEPAMEHGVFAPLYNVPAYTMTFLTNLASRTGAPVVFAMMERLPNARGYRLHYLRPDQSFHDNDPEVSAAALNRSVEQCISIAPSQYMWSYKRFKYAPTGESRRY